MVADYEVAKEWTFYDPEQRFVAYRIRKMWWPTGQWVYSVTKMYGWPDANHFSTFRTAVEFVYEKLEEMKQCN